MRAKNIIYFAQTVCKHFKLVDHVKYLHKKYAAELNTSNMVYTITTTWSKESRHILRVFRPFFHYVKTRVLLLKNVIKDNEKNIITNALFAL